MQTVLNTPAFEVKLTGRAYDFIAVVENHDPNPINLSREIGGARRDR